MIGVYGVSLINKLGVSVDEIWSKLLDESEYIEYSMPMDIPLLINKREYRRMSRYAYMTLYGTKQILESEECKNLALDLENVGTIFNTVYGPFNINLSFAEKVYKDDPDIASPMVFASTVSNAAVGHVCMNLGLKGPSTILMGSNNIGYSYELLKSGKGEAIFTGGIEEYNASLSDAYKRYSNCNTGISEAIATMLLKECKEDDIEKCYCEIVGYTERNIGTNPLVEPEKEINANGIVYSIEKMLYKHNVKPEEIDLVFTAKDGSETMEKVENRILDEIFDNRVDNVFSKSIFGETMGASLSLNTIIAALCLKMNYVPKRLINKEADLLNPKYILVNSLELTGLYSSILLRKVS